MFRHFSRRIATSALSVGLAVGVVTGSLLAGTASPAITTASATARPSAASMLSISGTGRHAADLRTALDHIQRAGDGQFTLDSAGLSSRERSTDSALVASLNRIERLEPAKRQAGISALTGSSIVEVAYTVPAAPTAGKGPTVVTLVPGATLTFSSTEVILNVSPKDVTEIENGATLGAAIASLVSSILNVAQVPAPGAAIASVVASSLTVGSAALKFCSGNDGGRLHLAFIAPKGKFPTASACGVTI
jgi:hypothetical protein